MATACATTVEEFKFVVPKALRPERRERALDRRHVAVGVVEEPAIHVRPRVAEIPQSNRHDLVEPVNNLKKSLCGPCQDREKEEG